MAEPNTSCASIGGGEEIEWSGDDDNWLDDFPLSTVQNGIGQGNERNLPQGSSSSENSESEDDDNGGAEPSTSKGKQTTYTPVQNRRWISYPPNFSKPHKIPEFDNTSKGLDASIDKEKVKTPLDFFRLFFNIEILASLVTSTNQYAKDERQKNPDKHRGKWTEVTIGAVTRFLGLTFLMGLIKKPRYKDYWTTTYELATPFFRTVMSRDRFIQILRYINFPSQANPSQGVNKAVGKMEYLFSEFNKMAKKLYHPGKNLSVDESMVAHKGRTIHRQYMPAKPTKWGLKVWVVAESVTGYVIQALPYFRPTEPTRPFRIYEDVVLRLLRSANLLGKRHNIYFDNYYTSVPMFDELSNLYQTYCCGTIRKNRKFLPTSLMQKKLPNLKNRGDSQFSKSQNLLLCVWKDRNLVHLLTTIHGSELGTSMRNIKDAKTGKFSKEEISCPKAIKDYSAFMGGVDLADQLYNYYCFGRKSQKWTKKLFWFMLELMKLNSYIMFNSVQEKPITLYDFTMKLLTPLFAETMADEYVQRSLTNISNGFDRLYHRCLPDDLTRKSYCKVCYGRYQVDPKLPRRQTKYGCAHCDAHLCLPSCFRIYHSVANYAATVAPAPAEE